MDVISRYHEKKAKRHEQTHDDKSTAKEHNELKAALCPVYQCVEQLHNAGLGKVTPWRQAGSNKCYTKLVVDSAPRMIYVFWIGNHLKVTAEAYTAKELIIRVENFEKEIARRVFTEASVQEIEDYLLDLIIDA